MNEKNVTVALVLTFIPVCFAIISLFVQFEICDLMYLIAVCMVVIRYYISKIKGKKA